MKLAAFVILLAACGGPTAYERVTNSWTREAKMRDRYDEALSVKVTYKSLEWREAFAKKSASDRGLEGAALEARLAQAKADDAGPLEFEMLVTTWDRRENDLDRGKRSVWTVRLLDDQGMEVEPLEIVKDKRPERIIRAEFPAMSGFAIAYVARFPRDKITTTANLRLHMSSPKGGVRLVWAGK
jgi:hypothetical protein